MLNQMPENTNMACPKLDLNGVAPSETSPEYGKDFVLGCFETALQRSGFVRCDGFLSSQIEKVPERTTPIPSNYCRTTQLKGSSIALSDQENKAPIVEESKVIDKVSPCRNMIDVSKVSEWTQSTFRTPSRRVAISARANTVISQPV
jgi:hypothetical protein